MATIGGASDYQTLSDYRRPSDYDSRSPDPAIPRPAALFAPWMPAPAGQGSYGPRPAVPGWPAAVPGRDPIAPAGVAAAADPGGPRGGSCRHSCPYYRPAAGPGLTWR